MRAGQREGCVVWCDACRKRIDLFPVEKDKRRKSCHGSEPFFNALVRNENLEQEKPPLIF